MAIVYTRDKQGAFIAGDTETRVTVYAYPTSPNAGRARRNPAATAADMIASEYTAGERADYDRRNWLRLEAGK